jgi:FkbM family methyltransferase
MSTFVRDSREYARRFEVSRGDRWRMLVAYPLFRLMFEAEYGSGPLGALGRRLSRVSTRWCLTQRVHGPGATVLVPVRFAPGDLASFSEVFFGGEYEPPLPAASTLVDAGANTGMATLFFAAHYGLDRILVVEPNPALRCVLERNLESVRDRTSFVHAALTDRDGGAVDLFVGGHHRHSAVGAGDGAPVAVPSRSLRCILDEHGFDEVDILKLDIEGSEHRVVSSDPEILDRVRCVVAELHGTREARDATAELLVARGFGLDHDRRPEVDVIVARRDRGA